MSSQQNIIDEITKNLPTNNNGYISAKILRQTLTDLVNILPDFTTAGSNTTLSTQNLTIADATSVGTPNLILYNGATEPIGSFVGSGVIFNCNNSNGLFHTAAYINGGYVDNTAGHEKGLIDFEVYRGLTATNLIVTLACNDTAFWFAPGTDNIASLGISGFQWSNIYSRQVTLGKLGFSQANVFTGGVASTGIIGVRGTDTPITDSSAVAVFQAVTNITSGSGCVVYGSIVKENSANIENHVFFAEAVDAAGGGSIAGGRFTASLLLGTGGNASGVTNVGLSQVPYAFVVGAENQCWLGGTATEATTTFSKSLFACGVLSSCAWTLSADAGFMINPLGFTPGHAYITGFLVPTAGATAGNDPVVDTGFRCDAKCVNAIDVSRGTYSGKAIKASGWSVDNLGNNIALTYNVGANQVVGARATGWAVATGTPSRATFTTSGVTLATLAGVVMALEQDLITHGLIGA